MTNKLFYGDNLDVLRRKIESGSVDLCYIDPPFNSKRNYFQIYNNQGSEDRAQAQAFVDTWSWEDEAVEGLDYILDLERLHPRAGDTAWTEQTVELIRGLERVLGRGSLLAYLVHMTLRIVEIHRVLKPTGSFYLHCDPTASHYLKLVLDAVFCGQGGDYWNEIIWKRTFAHKPTHKYSPVHDVIFFYGKSLARTWNAPTVAHEDEYLKRFKNWDAAREEGYPVELGLASTRSALMLNAKAGPHQVIEANFLGRKLVLKLAKRGGFRAHARLYSRSLYLAQGDNSRSKRFVRLKPSTNWMKLTASIGPVAQTDCPD